MKEINIQNYKNEIKSGNIIVDFFGKGCGACKMIEPFLNDLESEHTNVTFIKIDVDQAAELVNKYGITSIPTLLFIKDGKLLETIIGLRPRGVLSRMITELFN